MITKENTALHLIDAQERLFGVMHNGDFLKSNMQKMIAGAKVLGIPIAWMEQYPKGLGPTLPELRELLVGQEPGEKSCFSSCMQKGFNEDLKSLKRENILVMGIEAHVCVYQTVQDLLEQGYQVQVIADAVSSRTPENHELALRIMEQMGARLTTVEMALFELLQKSGTDEFKQISKLVK